MYQRYEFLNFKYKVCFYQKIFKYVNHKNTRKWYCYVADNNIRKNCLTGGGGESVKDEESENISYNVSHDSIYSGY